MKQSIKNQGSAAFFLVGLGLVTSLFSGCSVGDEIKNIIAPPTNFTCHCSCLLTSSMPASHDPPNSDACHQFCASNSAGPKVCTESDPTGGTGGTGGSAGTGGSGGAGAAGKAGSGGSAGSCTVQPYAYCVTCSEDILKCSTEFDFDACSMTDAQNIGNADARSLGSDCSAHPCTAADEGALCPGSSGGTGGSSGSGGTGGTATAGAGGTSGTGGSTGGTDTGTGGTDTGTGGDIGDPG